MKIWHVFALSVVALLTAAMLFNAGWVRPPILSTQTNYRGTGAAQLTTPAAAQLLQYANKLPDAIDKASPDGDRAGKAYQNVKVLGDLSVDQFNRVMLGLAAWVAPADQSCNYCHGENMADDTLYTKRVARRMLEMTRHINKDWKSHVGLTGVTCYTCHRGMPVPNNIWFAGHPANAGGFAASNDGFGHPTRINGSTSLSGDPLSALLEAKDQPVDQIRVQSSQALPTGLGAPIKATERTYALMIAMSESLGVNCTFCHNSRAFSNWDQSTPQRVTAYYGIALTQDLNTTYLDPLKAEFPPNRLGPGGDGPKLYCATCHQGATKPLLGVSMAKDWPELGGGDVAAAAPASSPSPTPSAAPSPAATPAPAATPSPPPTAAPSATASPTPSASAEPTASPSATASPEPAASPSPAPAASPEPMASPSAAASPEPTASPSPTDTPAPTPSKTP